jgi:AcrR family transcriptional regulator
MTQSLRERRRQALRAEILEATHILLAERGYAALSMEELAARVGVSKPTLYSQFPTREDLLAAMAGQLLERVFVEAAVADHSPLERLLGLLHAIVRLQVERRTTAMQLWLPEILDILERNPATRTQLLAFDQLVVTLLREAVECGEIDPATDLAGASRVFNALICTPYFARLGRLDAPDPQTLADTVVRVFRNGVAPERCITSKALSQHSCP